jgi:hypothetical protein
MKKRHAFEANSSDAHSKQVHKKPFEMDAFEDDTLVGDDVEHDIELSGIELVNYIQVMMDRGDVMTAKAACIICHWATLAGVKCSKKYVTKSQTDKHIS